MNSFELLFLGTGTSTGVPMIGCDCPVCRSKDPRNRRRRSGLYVRAGETCVVIDTPPEFREQALEHDLRQLDALLFTHAHADHVFGLDDIRRFNTIQDGHAIPVYAATETIVELQRIFSYMTKPCQKGLFRPKVSMQPVEAPFRVAPLKAAHAGPDDLEVVPFEVAHGDGRTQGFRLNWRGRSFGYAPDCQSLPAASVSLLHGVNLMILDALRYRPHPTHLNVEESLAVLSRIGAPRALLTHLCHDIDHAQLSAQLPPWVQLSYDGLRVQL
ncbi:MAG: MBL fold metallo-hydrolase [Kiritimatiellae bacterium]|nr:MBL fold metallo-hydrolase [Kiritimatiellia bacterium]